MAKATSAEDYKLISSFEEVKKLLLDGDYVERLERPLAYWALPNDRRLPLAFLGRTVRNLLDTPFNELSATAGIGQKKISTLVKLLHRATKAEPPAVPFGLSDLASEAEKEVVQGQIDSKAFDPAFVSEALWAQWRDTVRKNGVGQEKLGRLAPTLQSLPTVIWHTSLDAYLNYSVSEIRQLKTHGEKRVRVVLEVFYVVHEMLSNASKQSHLDIRLVPKFIAPIDEWISDIAERGQVPSADALRDMLVIPILKQIEVDAGPTVHALVTDRLGVTGDPQNVRTQARRLGVTRARIYQLLDDCSKVMRVRWPEGEGQLANLAKMFAEASTGSGDLRLFNVSRELFYPEKYSQMGQEESDLEGEL